MTATSANRWVNSSNKNNPEIISKTCRILNNVIYCSLSTCSADGFPWVSPVFYAFDKQVNLYWSSAIESKHSQNIYNNNGKAAIAIYNSSTEEGTVEGLYFYGHVHELTLEGAKKAFDLLQQRAGKVVPRIASDYVGESPRRIYQFKSSQCWTTGERLAVGNQLVDTKVEISVNSLIDAIA